MPPSIYGCSSLVTDLQVDETADSVSEKIVQKNIVEKDELTQRGLNHMFLLLPQ